MEVCLVHRERCQLVALEHGEQGVLSGAAPPLPSLRSLSLLYHRVSIDFSNPISKKILSLPLGLQIWPQSFPNGKDVPGLSLLLRLWTV